jgi:sulfite reductase (NADPH) flavoprotein alpha-component
MAALVKNIENALQNSPFDESQKELIKKLVESVSVEQVFWLGGFLTGINTAKQNGNGWDTDEVLTAKPPLNQSPSGMATEKPAITIMYGSRTGNGEEVAENARRIALSKGFSPVLKDMTKFKPAQLVNEKYTLIIVSTHGDGVPPLEAEDMYNFLHENSLDLKHMHYSVCALGDSSYQKFCQTGKDFDAKLESFGAHRIYDRQDCDVDYEEHAEIWLKGALDAFSKILKTTEAPPVDFPNVPTTSKVTYNKKKPFMAAMLDKVNLNGRGSKKETYHIELSLEGSGLTYEPGDSLGVYSTNDERLVNKVINFLKLNPYDQVNTNDGSKDLLHALTNLYELSLISIEVMKKYAALSPNKQLEDLLNNPADLPKYIYGRDILDLITDFPISGITANELVNVLRKLPARLYSIASSPNLHPDEVHITVAAVRFLFKERERLGVCSTFLADKITSDTKVPVYVERNKSFRLPNDPATPIIMVGPGTGIAPFRAFMEERSISGGDKNWLFFGDQHFTTDFLYQLEWQRYLKKKLLHRLDVAFSRDQSEKIYVQHKMQENSKELYAWIQDGAHFYVCGDEKHMSRDVHQALVGIMKNEGGMTVEKAEEYVKNMQKSRRYQEDVY